jgi:hypothetical protein
MKLQDETELTTHIASALNDYISGSLGRSCTMNSARQALELLQKKDAFADIVKRLDKNTILSLEVKTQATLVRDGRHKFKSYNAVQRRIYEALFECGVPVFYCYNRDEAPQEHLTSLEILDANNSSEPADVCDNTGVIESFDSHGTLKNLIDDLRTGKQGKRDCASDILFPYLAGETTSRVGIRQLLLAYNSYDKSFDLYDHKFFETLVPAISASLKKKMNLPNDLSSMTKEEIVSVFQMYRSDFKSKISKVEQNWRSDSGVEFNPFK